jgi:hypothetical protein
MTERPILFSAPMVRALLNGSKTQTRRVLRDQDPIDLGAIMHGTHLSRRPVFDKVANAVIGHRLVPVLCPHGQPGDRLWAREAYRLCSNFDSRPPSAGGAANRVWYEADAPHQPGFGKGRPSIHMPRWASRITLEITGVRVERLQAISEADARAEGCLGGHGSIPGYAYNATPGEQFIQLWKSINGAESWDANPFVWVVEFERKAT